MRAVTTNVLKEQFIDEVHAPFLKDLRDVVKRTDDPETVKSQLRQQLDLLQARHLYISGKLGVHKIATRLGIKRSLVIDWVDLYGWKDMKQARLAWRSRKFASAQVVNQYVIERETDDLMRKVMNVSRDLLDGHFDGGQELDPAGLKSVTESVAKAFEIRGALAGSEKVGQKIKISISHELGQQIGDMMKMADAREVKPAEIAGPGPQITIEDVEFDSVPDERQVG